MHPTDYQKALLAAHAEIEEILGKRTQLDERLNQLRKTIDALSALLENTPTSKNLPPLENLPAGIGLAGALEAVASLASLSTGDVGISDAIRQILSESQVPVAPVGVRNELMKRRFSLAEYVNPLAVIHNTLKRLLAQGEILGVRDRTGQVVAYARRTVPPPPGSDEIEDSLHQMTHKE